MLELAVVIFTKIRVKIKCNINLFSIPERYVQLTGKFCKLFRKI